MESMYSKLEPALNNEGKKEQLRETDRNTNTQRETGRNNERGKERESSSEYKVESHVLHTALPSRSF